jgi:hypothetical protein
MRAAPSRARPALELAVLWLAAALVAAFTARDHLEPFDEGLLLQAGLRVGAGEWPYADFSWAYGPGHPLLEALAFEAFGPSVLAWRVVWVMACATIAVLIWGLVRRTAGPRWALVAWLAAATTASQPMLANPVVPALALALGAVALAVARRPALAGLLVALTAFWRPDFGAFALAAVAASLLAGGGDAGRGAGGAGGRAAVRAALVAVGAGALLFCPFAVAAGPAGLWRSLVTDSLHGGAAWRLPFPLAYDGPLRAWPPGALAHDAKDALGYEVPLAGAVALLAALALAPRWPRAARPAAAGLAVLGLGGGVYLLSRADEFHAQPLLLCACGLVPLAVAALPRRQAAIPVAALAVVLAGGVANRVSALAGPEDLVAVHLPGVPGIRVPPAEARGLPGLVRTVDRLVPAGEAIYVAPRRSDLVTSTAPIVHFLVRRPNLLRRDALLQAEPAEQARIVAALRRARTRVVVRWTSPASARPEPNARGRPSGSSALDDYLASAYRLDARFGAYDVLVRRP